MWVLVGGYQGIETPLNAALGRAPPKQPSKRISYLRGDLWEVLSRSCEGAGVGLGVHRHMHRHTDAHR